MTTSLLHDAFAHHAWATERLIEVCAALSADQLATQVPGTYGSISGTLGHLVASDAWYLSFFPVASEPFDDEASPTLDDMRAALTRNAAAWTTLLEGELDPDEQIAEQDGEWELHSPVGVRLAQVVHHGTDHRSQVCTALTTLGIEPPEIDVWAYARASNRERAERLPAE
ncbi:MAG: DinB family protein [Chloroflexi bacterium]|nr:DinB family protein [Chloroflexota bacterium]